MAAVRATSLVLLAALVLGPHPLVRAAEPETESAEQLYEDGRKAYRLGRYDEAVKKFERSYELSDQPLLLYNIALSYKRLYGISKEVSDLRRSKTVFEEFINVASADANLATEIDDARARLAEIDEEITRAESAAAAGKAANETSPTDPSPQDRKLRIGGAVAMGVGGGLLVAGVALGTYYVVRAPGFRDDIAQEKMMIADPACHAENPPSSCPSNAVDRLATHRKNLSQANLGIGLGFGLVAGLGVAAIVTGAVLFALGSRSKGAAANAFRIAPSVSPRLAGFEMSGRF
jgi:tetratricopeptide (TPR) repeat protein